MKQEIAHALAASPLLAEVKIERQDGGWVVHVLGEGGAAITPSDSRVETARGGVRVWASLDTAQRWVEDLLGPEPAALVHLVW